MIRKIQGVVLDGGLYAQAMPRGFGKTAICVCSALWAVLYGHRRFVVLLGSTATTAEEEMLDSIKAELQGNDLLLHDFPEVVYPIRRLEGITQRRKGQLCQGLATNMIWRARQIMLPTISSSKSSGGVIAAAGLTGRLRGMTTTLADGTMLRPDLVLPDDPQTRESAESVTQCAKRERIILGDVLGLAGQGKRIACLMPCTVIWPDDLAHRFLDRKKHPAFQGDICKAVYAFSTRQDLWSKYAEILADAQRRELGDGPPNEFYIDNRVPMDEGCVVAWPERFNEGEVSAIQHCMNVLFRDRRAFFAEYQNEPQEEHGSDELTADQIAEKHNGLGRGLVPLAATRLTAFIDVGQTLHWYVVLATADDFTGWVIDYGTQPDQRQTWFSAKNPRMTLAQAAKGASLEGSLLAGLQALADQLLGREWEREGGTRLRIERCLVDASWGTSTDLVYTFCRHPSYGAVLFPSHGRYVGAASTPITRYQPKPGERIGLNWILTHALGKRATRHVLYDANFWKSFVHSRFAVALGDKGCFSIFGDRPDLHRLFAEHVTAEYRIPTEARGRTVDEWKLRTGRDNHLFDCLVGAATAASIQGAALFGEHRPRKRVRYSDMQQQAKRYRHAKL